MTHTDHEQDALREEWLARREAALKHRTAARLVAADNAFRAYRQSLTKQVPAQRRPAEESSPV